MIDLPKNGTVRRKCTCKNTFQDKRCGNGVRVMNICQKGIVVRCTVCRTEYRA